MGSEVEDDSRLKGDALVEGQFKPERMNALTDGVFAIVLTLLVLDLKLPETDESILALMSNDRRVFIAWLISFLLIARFWLVHHAVTARLQQCHVGTLALNFGVLGSVSLVPFSADLIGTERIAEPWSTIVFAGNVGLMSLSVGLLARHALREPYLLHPDQSRTVLSRHRSHHLYVLPTVAMASVLLAFVHPYLAVGVLLAEFVVVTVWGGWHFRTRSRLDRTRPHAFAEGSS
ncbi:TMEM175 family protein [Promicromonospora sp. NPDC057138]|uniref:TMEM175 family protein n=1 Tax=Promicromonospora sp. NPDC057138 TaxID=3346031 RepID=UPI00362AAE31